MGGFVEKLKTLFRDDAPPDLDPVERVSSWAKTPVLDIDRKAARPTAEDRCAQAIAIVDDQGAHIAARRHFLVDTIQVVDQIKSRPPVSS